MQRLENLIFQSLNNYFKGIRTFIIDSNILLQQHMEINQRSFIMLVMVVKALSFSSYLNLVKFLDFTLQLHFKGTLQ